MKISASIYSNKEKELEQLVRELDAHGIDMFHIDCFDESVFEDIQRIRQISKTPIDLHIIHKEPGKFLQQISDNRVDFVSIQYGKEVVVPALPRNTNTKWGLALTTNNALDAFSESDFDFVLFMASEPGVSGKPFDKSNFQRIIDFKSKFPKKKIEVDGGINDSIAFILRLLGVDTIVSGNYLLNQEYLGAGMLNLHKAPNGASKENFQIADFMMGSKYLPVVKSEELNLRKALEVMEKFAMGFVLVTENNGRLSGVISNADVRRAFIRHLDNLNAIDVLSMVNTQPVTIAETGTLTDMLHLLNDLNFIILFLPVVNAENQLKGAVLLNNLTRV